MATLKIIDLSVGDWVRYSGRDYQVKNIDGALERVTLIGHKEQRDESIYACRWQYAHNRRQGAEGGWSSEIDVQLICRYNNPIQESLCRQVEQ